ncbi:S1C family serine protease [Nonomuraea jiangxiensis]|uniref:Serine protease, S1-C subfamily, contains C-terminal PDZ domain n=1 Tax=Nonomuraea jiangxiensis TaxID=633440 RepID=A0A1G8EX07_9ACTN|nr:trypsin-like peptidase domain-containing protein [Nonomuraea jiangxiensis]SDH74337.1 serine protease, S1-C subfamily, contains C-terminal PDZ domain [Nonomuraea jiangxiensis]
MREIVAGIAAAVLVLGCGAPTATRTPSPTTTASVTPTPTPSPTAHPLEAAYEQVIKDVLPSIVQITTKVGLGSGIVYDTAGHIVTNAHVVGEANELNVTTAGGTALKARLVKSFGAGDLAVIKVDKPNGLRPARFGDSSKLRVGQIVLAMGNPLGLSGSVTNGIVSALGRTVSEPQNPGSPGATIAGAIQTSAAINPGNSGGALVDLSGQVIGIPTLAAIDPDLGGSAAPGIGFAIPSNTVTDIASQIVKQGKVTNSHRAALGIRASTVIGENGDPGGVGVVSAEPGGGAAKAGIRPGDVIVSINGKDTLTMAQLSEVLTTLKPGDRARVGVVHPSGKTATVTVTLGQLPGD